MVAVVLDQVQVAVQGPQVVEPGRLCQMQENHAMISEIMVSARSEMTANFRTMCSRQCLVLLVQHRSSQLVTWQQKVPQQQKQSW